MKRFRNAAIVVGALTLGTAVSAALIGVGNFVNSAFPRTDAVANFGSVNFDAASRILSIIVSDAGGSSPFSTRWNPLAGVNTVAHRLTPTQNTLSIYIKINDTAGFDYSGCVTSPGSCAGLVPPSTLADFVLTGSYDINGNGVVDAFESGVLLKGSVTQFGFANALGSAQDRMDFHFAPTGGLWVDNGWYQQKEIGVTDVVESNTWPDGASGAASFAFGFQGSSKLNVLPVDCAGAIGDFVWDDLNQDGIQNPGEPGLNGVVVNLFSSPGHVLLDSKTTQNSAGQPGFYKFTGLCTGDYSVEVVPPANKALSPSEVGPNRSVDSNPSPSPVHLAGTPTGYSDLTVDFGFSSVCTGSIGDFVWHDLNDNGIQDAGEPGIQNVTINLMQGASTIASTQTGANGAYGFHGLCQGTYTVAVDLSTVPAGLVPTPTNQTVPGLDSNPNPATVTLPTDSTAEPTIDFGFQDVCSGVIGNFVWFDQNGNGLQDLDPMTGLPIEDGIDGITITLDGPGGLHATTTTGPHTDALNHHTHGFYQFTGVCEGGPYTVTVSAPGFTPTTADVGSDDTVDSDGLAVPGQPGKVAAQLTMPSDSTINDTIDFGYTACGGSVGDFVWQDLNLNGLQDFNEPGFPGVVVNLRRLSDYAILQTATSGNDGHYKFLGVCPGTYFVEMVPPPNTDLSPTLVGPDRTVDSNENAVNPNNVAVGTVTLTVGNPSDNTIDFGLRARGSIGDYVWKDSNGDGIQNDGGAAAGFGGLLVTLIGPSGTQTTTTLASGFYQFSNLPMGTYSVRLAIPPGSVPSPILQGTPDTDSNGVASGSNIVAASVVLSANDSSDQTIDFGFYLAADLSITKDDFTTTVNAGASTTYTVMIHNAGPSAVVGALFKDPVASNLTLTNVTCAGGVGAVCPPPASVTLANLTGPGISVDLPANATLAFMVTALVAVNPSANSVTNTVTITPPTGTVDLTPQDNTASDTDTIPSVDLFISKTDGVTSVTPGATTTYTVTVQNNGPASVTGAFLTDPAVAGLDKNLVVCSATPGQCTPATTPNVTELESGSFMLPTLAAGQTYQILVRAVVTASSGNVINRANVTVPPGTPNTGASCVSDATIVRSYASPTCTSTDTDTVTPTVDLLISKTDGVNNVAAGGTTTYTVTVRNNGPASVTGAILRDASAAGLTKTAVSCSPTPGQCTAGTTPTVAQLESAGGFALPALASGQTYQLLVAATVTADSGSVTNTSSVTPPGGTTNTGTSCVSDLPPGTIVRTFASPTCSSPDTDTVTPSANLVISKTDGAASVNAGGTTTYTITVVNDGPSSVTGAFLSDPAVAGLSKTAVACSPTPGQCATPPSVAQLESGTFTLPTLTSGQTYQIAVIATVTALSGSVTNIANVTPPPGTTNPGTDCVTSGGIVRTFVPPTCSSPDTDTVNPSVDLLISKTDGVTSVTAGGTTTYTVTVQNNGPSSVTGAILHDAAVVGLTKTAVVCSPTPGQCAVATTPTVAQLEGGAFPLPTLAPGQTFQILVTASITAMSGTVTNIASVTPPGGTTNTGASCVSDGPPGTIVRTFVPPTCSSPDTDTVTPSADLVISKTDGIGSVNAGAATTYTVTVLNNGPSTVTGAILSDPAVAGLSKTVVACSATPGQCAAPPTVAQLESGAFALPALTSGQTYQILVTAIVTAPTGSVTNTASIAPPPGTTVPGTSCVPGAGIQRSFNPATSTCSSPDTDTVTPAVDLFVSKTDGVTNVIAGSTTTYTITVRNNGPSTVTGAILSDPEMAGLNKTAVACSATPGQCTGPTTPTVAQLESGAFTLPTLTSGQTYQITVKATVTSASGNVTNIVSVTPPPGTPNTGTSCVNDVSPGTIVRIFSSPVCMSLDTDTVTPAADLFISKTDGVTNVVSGSATTYTITVQNNGPSTVTGAILSDPAVSGLNKTAVACAAAPGQCAAPPTVAQLEGGAFALPTLTSGQVYRVTVTATVTVSSGSVTNIASVTPPQGTPNSGTSCVNDMSPGTILRTFSTPTCSSPDTDTVSSSADLVISKTDGIGSVSSGAPTTYTVTVLNNGPATVTGAILSDPAVAGVAKTAVICSATPGQCAVPPTIGQLEAGTFALPALASGQTYQIRITATVTALSGSVTNIASITPPPGTTVPGTNCVSSGGIQRSFNQATSTCSSPDTDTLGQGQIGDTVWIDYYPNGVYDAGEFFLQGVTVRLLDAASNVIQTKVTDVNGKYLFTGLVAGTYTVAWVKDAVTTNFDATVHCTPGSVTIPNGVVCLPDGSNDSNGVEAAPPLVATAVVTLATDTSIDLTIDLGLITNAPLNLMSVGDFVWVDSNGNGIQDAGEPGIPNVKLVLAGPGIPLNPAPFAITNSFGIYHFPCAGCAPLQPGTYTVTLVAATVPAGYTPTVQCTIGVGACTKATDSSTGSATTVPPLVDTIAGSQDQTLDFGFKVAAASLIDLSLTKNVDNSQPALGSNVTFTVVVTNAPARATATGVTVLDLLPAGLTFVSSTVTQGSYVSGTGLWTVGTLASGASATLTIKATMATPGTKTNLAQVQSAGQIDVDSTPGNAPGIHEDDDASVTVTPAPAACVLGYPFTSSNPRTSTVFNESEVLQAANHGFTGGIENVRLFGDDEHAPLLGVRTATAPVTALPGVPGHVSNPLVGDRTKTDPFGRPIFPSVFVTDITNDPNSKAGDWQFGGTPVSPSDVFGVWKGASVTGSTITTDADPAKNNANLGPGSDAVPALPPGPPPPGGANQGYKMEARWNVSDLTINGQPLQSGHTYRLQFMVHDGDQNKTGGDVGQSCLNIAR